MRLVSLQAFRDEIEKIARANLVPVARELAEQASKQIIMRRGRKKPKKTRRVPTGAA